MASAAHSHHRLDCSLPPAFDSLTPPVNGLFAPTLIRLALEKFEPAKGPAENISGFCGDRASMLATPVLSKVFAI